MAGLVASVVVAICFPYAAVALPSFKQSNDCDSLACAHLKSQETNLLSLTLGNKANSAPTSSPPSHPGTIHFSSLNTQPTIKSRLAGHGVGTCTRAYRTPTVLLSCTLLLPLGSANKVPTHPLFLNPNKSGGQGQGQGQGLPSPTLCNLQRRAQRSGWRLNLRLRPRRENKKKTPKKTKVRNKALVDRSTDKQPDRQTAENMRAGVRRTCFPGNDHVNGFAFPTQWKQRSQAESEIARGGGRWARLCRNLFVHRDAQVLVKHPSPNSPSRRVWRCSRSSGMCDVGVVCGQGEERKLPICLFARDAAVRLFRSGGPIRGFGG
ncbi:uncharacterized protein IWZ02DRAFT_6711 [Phyllosticta citriasiana]|uniref:uncharacterized protein n=1 Tax=Phyllosticta citriasiana TaxID=595635 RepID=UPI0030FDF37B